MSSALVLSLRPSYLSIHSLPRYTSVLDFQRLGNNSNIVPDSAPPGRRPCSDLQCVLRPTVAQTGKLYIYLLPFTLSRSTRAPFPSISLGITYRGCQRDPESIRKERDYVCGFVFCIAKRTVGPPLQEDDLGGAEQSCGEAESTRSRRTRRAQRTNPADKKRYTLGQISLGG
jgi:hypothetical protein